MFDCFEFKKSCFSCLICFRRVKFYLKKKKICTKVDCFKNEIVNASKGFTCWAFTVLHPGPTGWGRGVYSTPRLSAELDATMLAAFSHFLELQECPNSKYLLFDHFRVLYFVGFCRESDVSVLGLIWIKRHFPLIF